jgi:hypothetical protein
VNRGRAGPLTANVATSAMRCVDVVTIWSFATSSACSDDARAASGRVGPTLPRPPPTRSEHRAGADRIGGFAQGVRARKSARRTAALKFPSMTDSPGGNCHQSGMLGTASKRLASRGQP